MPGVQHHINSSESKVHRLGMIVGEVVTATVDPDGPKLSFEVRRGPCFIVFEQNHALTLCIPEP